jgi:two-component system, NtrC family, sensor kinase
MKSLLKIFLLCLIPVFSIAQTDPTWGYVTAQQADSLKRSVQTEKNDTIKLAAYRSLGFYYQDIKRDTGLYFHEQQLTLSKKLNMKLWQADAYSQAAYVLNGLGNVMKSYEYFSEAMKLAGDEKNETDNWRPWVFSNSKNSHEARITILGMNYQMMGNLWFSLGELEKYKASYQEALRLGESVNNGKVIYLSSRVLAFVMSPDSALFFLQKSIETGAKAGYNRVGFSYLFMARNYGLKGMLDSAIIYVHKAIARFWLDKELVGLPIAYNGLSDIFFGQNNKDSSLFYAKKAIETTLLVGTPDINLVNAYKRLSTVYNLNNDKDDAYKYESLAYKLNDSLKNARIANLTEYQKFAFNEQLRLKKLDEEKTAYANNLKMLGLFVVLVGILVVALILYRNNRQKQKANAVLESTLVNLKSTQSQLIQSEKMASLGELTAGIAHEIQNPLNFVNNFSEVNTELIKEIQDERRKTQDKRDEKLEDEILQDIVLNQEKINHHGKRAADIVKGMLQHSRSSRGVKEPTNINALADEYLRLAYHGLRAKDKTFNATMKTEFDETIGNINIIPQDIGRVILNLITNAFYVVNEKVKQNIAGYEPTVTVSTKLENGTLAGITGITKIIKITVKDNGNGIPPKILDKIFQPFFTTKPTGHGTGLGLSLSYDIVKNAHQGEIKVITEEGKGTEFIVVLPI